MRCRIHRGTPVLIAGLLAITAQGSDAQSGPIANAVFVHGALADNEWGYAISALSNTFSFALDEVSVPYWYYVQQWRGEINNWQTPDSSILVGHSLGGVTARDASRFVSSAGIVTVGAPNTGAPVTGAVDEMMDYPYVIYGLVTNVAAFVIEEISDFFDEPWNQALAIEIYGYVDTWIYDVADLLHGYALDYLASYPPDILTTLAPGSAFLDSLPSGGTGDYALTIRMYYGTLGGPAALLPGVSQEQADDIGWELYAYGLWIYETAVDLEPYLIQGEHWWEGFNALVSAQSLGIEMMGVGEHWCGAVSYGDFDAGCLDHDGFIPVARQEWSGASNDYFAYGAPHTKQTTDSAVVAYVGDKLCTLSVC